VKNFDAEGNLVLANGWTIGRDYGHLAHGYCVTSHSSQGKTVDRVFIGQSSESLPASSREQFYVSVSRGRESAVVYTDDKQALMVAIKCERASHRFFKRYGERFEDSEGKQVFLEFAEEERQHLELLIREYRALITRTHGGRKSARATAAAARTRPKPARKLRPAT
jgi:hypothetical protein